MVWGPLAWRVYFMNELAVPIPGKHRISYSCLLSFSYSLDSEMRANLHFHWLGILQKTPLCFIPEDCDVNHLSHLVKLHIVSVPPESTSEFVQPKLFPTSLADDPSPLTSIMFSPIKTNCWKKKINYSSCWKCNHPSASWKFYKWFFRSATVWHQPDQSNTVFLCEWKETFWSVTQIFCLQGSQDKT